MKIIESFVGGFSRNLPLSSFGRGRAATVRASAGLRLIVPPFPVDLLFGLLTDFARGHAFSPCFQCKAGSLAIPQYIDV